MIDHSDASIWDPRKVLNLLSLSPEVQRLARLGDPGFFEDQPWLDYSSFGLRSDHIPDLISILENIERFFELPGEDQALWTPVHAWRALSQLHAAQALPALIKLLNRIDEEEDETIQVELPRVFTGIGPASLDVLYEFLDNPANPPWARIASAEGMQQIAMAHPAYRLQVVNHLTRALEAFADNRPAINSMIIELLVRLRAVEAAPVVEQAYSSGKVDEQIAGDWEDFQIHVGLLAERVTTPEGFRVSPIAFQDGVIHPPTAPKRHAADLSKKHKKKNRPPVEPKSKKKDASSRRRKKQRKKKS